MTGGGERELHHCRWCGDDLPGSNGRTGSTAYCEGASCLDEAVADVEKRWDAATAELKAERHRLRSLQFARSRAKAQRVLA